MAAPLIIHTAEELAEDRQEVVLMLHDFSFRSPEELLAGLTPPATPDMPMDMPMSDATGMPSGTSTGSATAPDLSDVVYDAFLANDRTLADPEVVRVERAGRIRLRVINGASASAFWLDLGGLQGKLVAVDGHGVQPVSARHFPLAIAQRLDILIDLPAGGAFPTLARLEGSRRQTGIILASPDAAVARLAEKGSGLAPPVDNSLELQLAALVPQPSRPADSRYRILLGGSMQPYRWTLDGAAWPHVQPLMLRQGERVEIDLVNQSMMAHPMHLHGHAFQVLAINGRAIRGAVRDTVLVEPKGSARIAFDADNPGRWAFHCHNHYHMMTGMMTEFRYEGIAV